MSLVLLPRLPGAPAIGLFKKHDVIQPGQTHGKREQRNESTVKMGGGHTGRRVQSSKIFLNTTQEPWRKHFDKKIMVNLAGV